MRELREADIIRIVREEWDRHVKMTAESIGISLEFPVGDTGDHPVISPELKVRHKDSQIRYTVVSVSPRDAILRTPEGKEFIVDRSEFESSYEVD